MNHYKDVAGVIPRPSTRATRPAHPTDFFGKFGTVRYQARGRWAELAMDVVPKRGPSGKALLVMSCHNSEEPSQYSCTTLSLSEARDVRALLDRAIDAMERADNAPVQIEHRRPRTRMAS